MEGWASKRRFSIVDFPEPDGPVITIGRWVSVTGPQTIYQLLYGTAVWKEKRKKREKKMIIIPAGAITEYPMDLVALKRKLDRA